MLIENAVAGIAVHEIVLDEAGRPVDYIFLSANAAFETHTGLRVADVLGRRVTEVLPGTERTPYIEVYGKLALGGSAVSFEHFSELLGRHHFINAYRVAEGRFATVFVDITDRKRAEAEVSRQSGLISSLLDFIPDLVFFKDIQGIYMGCNLPFAEFVGRPRNEIVGRSDYELFGPQVAASFRENDTLMLIQQEPRRNEEWITYPDGRRRLLDTLKTPYWGPDGR